MLCGIDVREDPELRLKSECREGDDRSAEKSTLSDCSVAQASESASFGTMARLRRAGRIGSSPIQRDPTFLLHLTQHTRLTMEGAFGRRKDGPLQTRA